MLVWLSTVALAADLHLILDMNNGRAEELSWPASESVSKRFGPVPIGKSSTVFLVTIQPSVFDPLQGVYRVELSVCAEWTRKKDHDRYCDRKELLAPKEGTARHEVSLKGKDTIEWSSEVWFTGEAPPTGLPVEPPPPQE